MVDSLKGLTRWAGGNCGIGVVWQEVSAATGRRSVSWDESLMRQEDCVTRSIVAGGRGQCDKNVSVLRDEY